MKKITLLFLFLTSTLLTHAQFPENFDNGLPTDWTTFIGENGLGTVENWTAEDGYMIVIWEAVTPGSVAEDWLVTPQVAITTTNSLLTFDQTDFNSPDFGSSLTVRISTGNSQTTHSDFTIVDTQNEVEITNGTAGVFSKHEVDLSAYEGQSIYIALVWGQNDGDAIAIDNVALANQNASAPDCAVNPTPANGATDVTVTDGAVSLSWDLPSTGDVATGYELFFGTTSGDLNSLGKFSGTSINITGSNYSTTYYWKIVLENAGGSATGCEEWSYTTEDLIPLVPDYSETFDSYPAASWSEASGAYGAPTGSSSFFTGDDFVNDTSHPNGRSARVNIYGSSTDEYLISPNFNLSGSTYYLNFDVGLVDFGTTTATTLGPDDYVAFLVTQDNGANWTELMRWDSTTPISEVGQSVTETELSGYGDNVQFAFYAFSDTSNEDTDFFIDNFQITSTTLSANDNTLEGFLLFPTVIKNELNFSSQENVDNISIFDMLGKQVLKYTPNGNSSINVSSLRKGVYLVRVSSKGKTGTYKIIKQ